MREFYFNETSHMQSFAKIKLSGKFSNLQYSELTDVFPAYAGYMLKSLLIGIAIQYLSEKYHSYILVILIFHI